jgi:hypothetical protein
MKKLALVSLIFGIMVIAGPRSAYAVVIGFDPLSPLTVSMGDTVNVDIVVSDLAGEIVSAFDLDVGYDSSLLTATGVLFGTELGANPLPFASCIFDLTCEAMTDFDLSTSGLVDLASTSLLLDPPLATIQDGISVTLATLQFTAIGTGDAALSFLWGPGQDVKGSNNQVIAPVSVSVPEPGTVLLFATGLIAAGFACRKHKRS